MRKPWIAWMSAPLSRLGLSILLLLVAARIEAAVIKDLRIGSNQEYVRLVLESDLPLRPVPSLTINGETLRVTMTRVDNDLSVGPFEDFNRDIVSLDILKETGTMRLEAVFSFTPVDVKTFSLTAPHRFIIDAYRSLAATAADLPQPNTGQVATLEAETRLAPSATEASVRAYRSILSDNSGTDGADDSRFQRRLLATLIGVTSMILLLLIFLIIAGTRREKSSKPSWRDYLPLTKDPKIEDLDSQLAEHLSTLSEVDAAEQASLSPSKVVEIMGLYRQKSELLSQRLDAVIAALKKSEGDRR